MSITDKLFVGFLGFLASFVLVYFVINLIKTKKKTAKIKVANSKIKCYFSPNSGVLSVTSKDPLFEDLLGFRRHKITSYKEVPDKYIYTSATVGGVTTGGITKIDGYIDGKERDTAKCEMLYKSVKCNAKNAEEITYSVVKKIELSPELLKEAKKSYISKYIQGNCIMVVEEVEMSSTVKHMTQTHKVNAFQSLESQGYPSYFKIEEIISWLRGEEIERDQNVEKGAKAFIKRLFDWKEFEIASLQIGAIVTTFSLVFVTIAAMIFGTSSVKATIIISAIITLISVAVFVVFVVSIITSKRFGAINAVVIAVFMVLSLIANSLSTYFFLEYPEEGDYSDHQCSGAYSCENDINIRVKETFSLSDYEYYCQEHYEAHLKYSN